jgi:hypothetical protein
MNEQQLAAINLALEALEDAAGLIEYECYSNALQLEAITALQSIIEQPAPAAAPVESPDDWSDWKVIPPAAVQEPVAWRVRFHYGTDGMAKRIGDWKLCGYSPTPEKDKEVEPLYTTPLAAQQKPLTDVKSWVDLTDEEIMAAPENLIACIAYVRNNLKEKNT